MRSVASEHKASPKTSRCLCEPKKTSYSTRGPLNIRGLEPVASRHLIKLGQMFRKLQTTRPRAQASFEIRPCTVA
jgi:hypothetical protein